MAVPLWALTLGCNRLVRDLQARPSHRAHHGAGVGCDRNVARRYCRDRDQRSQPPADAVRRQIGQTNRLFVALPLMIGLFAAAIANVRKPETHKRLMYVLMASMMTPAIARVFVTLLAPAGAADGPPPPFVAVPPGLVATLLIVVAMVYDWRTRGRPHKAYIYGGLLVLLEVLLVVPIAGTQVWMNIATALEHLTG